MSSPQRSAQLEIPGIDGREANLEAQPDVRPTPAAVRAEARSERRVDSLQQHAAERLAAHRLRRSHRHGLGEARLETERPAASSRIAVAVAERYAHSPSYHSFLADEAQKAVRQAEATAEIAARNAQAIATAQMELLAELDLWTAPQQFTPETAIAFTSPHPSPAAQADAPVTQLVAGGLTVRLYEDLGRSGARPPRPRTQLPPDLARNLEETQALEDEIAFRHNPVFDDFRDFSGSLEPLPANLVEFPRQLIAPRKARPRLAEGPLREETPRSPQLRIFEVEPEQISILPQTPSPAPEWASIRLGATQAGPLAPAEAADLLPSLLPLQTAAMSLRTMAALVDLILILATFLACLAAGVYTSDVIPTGTPAALAACAALALVYLTYQVIFFTFSDQTPGMRYARIGLCTFSDENPSRAAMRRRILAVLIAACPLGIGLLWMWLDDEGLGWHDRISRMYQRAY